MAESAPSAVGELVMEALSTVDPVAYIVALPWSIAISARPKDSGEFLGRIAADDNKGRLWVQRPPVIYVGFAGRLL